MAADFSGTAQNLTKVDKRIVFLQMSETLVKGRGQAAGIVLAVNIALITRKGLSHILLQQLPYNKKRNLSRLLRIAATSSILLPALSKIIMMVARQRDTVIEELTRDQG